MNKDDFVKFFKRKGKKPNVIEGFIGTKNLYEKYLKEQQNIDKIEDSTVHNLVQFVEWYENIEKKSVKGILWALSNVFNFLERDFKKPFASFPYKIY